MLGGKQECRKPDLAFLDPSLASSAEIPWSRIRAFGELRDDFAEIGKNQALHTIVVSMMHRARLIFQSQPGRRCIQTFTLGGDYLRCFVIDRAGVVASQAFSIHRKEKMALRVFWAFFHGAPAWYGLDPSIMGMLDRKESIFDPTSVAFDTVVPYIYIPDSASGSNIRVFLDRQPFEARQAVISKGSTLWRAKDESGRRLIVKDQWRNAERDAEGEFLKTLTGARGISKYIHHGDIMLPSGEVDRTNAIRAHLAVDNGVSVLPLYDVAYGYHETTPALSRWSRSRLSAEQEVDGKGEDPASDIPEYAEPLSAKGKRRLSTGSVKQSPKRLHVAETPVVSSLLKMPCPYGRVHSRLVMASDGRPLSTFRTATELFGAIRCALIGTRFHFNVNTLG